MAPDKDSSSAVRLRSIYVSTAASVDDAESQRSSGLDGIERAVAQDNGHYDDTKENPSDEEGDPDEPIPEPLQARAQRICSCY